MAVTKPEISALVSPEDLGIVYSEENQINSKFFTANVPFSDTTGNTQVNWGGKDRIIVLQGAQDGATFTGADQNIQLRNFILAIEDWVNSGTQTTRVYTDSFGRTYNVYMLDWSWSRSFSDPNRVIYTMTMKQA